MEKILYFEGAGWAENNGINCRIRTAFRNTVGKMMYLEIHSANPHNYRIKLAKQNGIVLPETYMYVDTCFRITDDPATDDENKNRIRLPELAEQERTEYTLGNIRDFVNSYLGCDFDEVKVLDYLAGYCVFTGEHTGTPADYNFGDVFEYDEELTDRRKEKVKELSAHFLEVFAAEFPRGCDNTSYFIKDGRLTVRLNIRDEARIKAGYPEREFTVPESGETS